jgi:6-pyruvoyl-tetrahydropterin synthase
MLVTLTRRVSFHATHHLRLAALTEAQNRARFGATVEPHAHGYTCDVTVAGPLPDSGALVDLAALDELLREAVVAPLDGQDLSTLHPDWAAERSLPTCEALAAWIWTRLEGRLPTGARLERVRVAEDETLWAECERPRAAS